MAPRLRNARRVVCGIVLFTAAILSAPALEAQASYALSCRGGGAMVMRFAPTSEGYTHLTLFFKRAAAGASQRLPGAGECAFLDRAVSADEPDLMRVTFSGVRTKLDIGADGQLRDWDFSGEDIRAAKRLRDLLDGIRAGEAFTMQVRAAGSGENRYFEVTRTGP